MTKGKNMNYNVTHKDPGYDVTKRVETSEDLAVTNRKPGIKLMQMILTL